MRVASDTVMQILLRYLFRLILDLNVIFVR